MLLGINLGPAILWEGAAGVLVGSLIPLWWAGHRRRVERKGEIDAMHVEMHQSIIALRALINENIMAPLYRLPVSITKLALPKLIGDGVLDANETSALVEYVNRAEEVNRGLDRAGAAHAAQNYHLIGEEHARLVAKARDILELKLERHGGDAIYDAATWALLRLQGKVDPKWWASAFHKIRDMAVGRRT